MNSPLKVEEGFIIFKCKKFGFSLKSSQLYPVLFVMCKYVRISREKQIFLELVVTG